MNLFSSFWFTWKGKDGYGGSGGHLQIKIFYFLLTKKTGKMARAQGNDRENTGNLVLIVEYLYLGGQLVSQQNTNHKTKMILH